MKRKLILICSALLIAVNLYAGRYGACAASAPKHKLAEKATLSDPGENDYDIKYLKFNLHVTDTSVYVWGDVSTTALITAPSMINYVFELDTLMVIDSAKVNGTLLSVTNVGFVRTIALPAALPAGSYFTAQIFYHGVPPPGGGFFNGLTYAVSGGGTKMIYTVSDPWVALDWWPVKQSCDDKIDSVDMFVTVPRGVVDGSNGILVNVDTSTTPGFWQYHWQTHYAIDYYLISIAVARFGEYKSYMHFTGSTDSMLIQNFFTDTTTFNPLYKANFDSIDQIINFYSSLFGRYPFWQEKYGVCYTTLPGGMENQTMTTIGVPNTYIIAHELMHQWFGDHVTYLTWGEMWLSEGFACFSEQLFLDHFWGPAAGAAHRQGYLNTVLGDPCGETYVTDTSGPNTLFNQPTVYDKGQGIVTMLRYMAPSDSVFFLALRTYQQYYAFSNASIANLNNIVDSLYGYSVDSFFRQWIYGSGFPKYTVTWDQVGTTVLVKLVQAPSCSTKPTFFYTPVELQLYSASTGNTAVVWAYDTLTTQVFTYDWAQPMDSLVLNPDFLTICRKIGIIKQDTALRLELTTGHVATQAIKIFPNPTKNFWQIDHLPEKTQLILTDINGRNIWQGESTKGSTIIPGDRLPAGSYLLKVGDRDSLKLVHW
jgi:aminopeptidase N